MWTPFGGLLAHSNHPVLTGLYLKVYRKHLIWGFLVVFSTHMYLLSAKDLRPQSNLIRSLNNGEDAGPRDKVQPLLNKLGAGLLRLY